MSNTVTLESVQPTNCARDGQFSQEQEEGNDAILHSSAVWRHNSKAGNISCISCSVFWILGNLHQDVPHKKLYHLTGSSTEVIPIYGNLHGTRKGSSIPSAFSIKQGCTYTSIGIGIGAYTRGIGKE